MQRTEIVNIYHKGDMIELQLTLQGTFISCSGRFNQRELLNILFGKRENALIELYKIYGHAPYATGDWPNWTTDLLVHNTPDDIMNWLIDCIRAYNHRKELTKEYKAIPVQEMFQPYSSESSTLLPIKSKKKTIISLPIPKPVF